MREVAPFRTVPLVLLIGAIAVVGTIVANALYPFSAVELLAIFLVALLGASVGLAVVAYAFRLDAE